MLTSGAGTRTVTRVTTPGTQETATPYSGPSSVLMRRSTLRSPRWGAALKGGRLPELANPEMNPTSTARSVAFWFVLALITFVIIVAGYGTGLWRL